MNDCLAIVREINRHAKNNYGSTKSEHIPFLQNCNNSLINFFNSTLKNNYIFSALAYKNNNANTSDAFNLVPISSSSRTNYYFSEPLTPEIEKFIFELLKESQHEKTIINLTNLLLKDISGCDLFFLNNKDDYSGIDGGAIKFFTIGDAELKFYEDPLEFYYKNKSKVDEFVKLIGRLDDYQNSDYARYLWHYKRIENAYLIKNPSKNFYFHFIRPSFIEFDYNVLLALATNRTIEDELAFIDTILFRIVGQMAIEKTREAERLKLIQNISISAHAVKTGINGLLSPPLDVLGQTHFFNEDVKEALVARDKILAFTELINVVTKISNKSKEREELKTLLKKSKLFDYKRETDLSKVLVDFLRIWHRDKNRTTIIIPETTQTKLSDDFLKYGDLTPTAGYFYLLLVMTIIENCNEHGYKERKDVLKLNIEFEKHYIKFSNMAKPNVASFAMSLDNTTGNIHLFFLLLEALNIGQIEGGSDGTTFFIKIKTK